jgi:hypothetical protein
VDGSPIGEVVLLPLLLVVFMLPPTAVAAPAAICVGGAIGEGMSGEMGVPGALLHLS